MASLTTTSTEANESTPVYYGPSQTALLLLDFHSLFVQNVGGPKAPAALEGAVKMKSWAKSLGIQVIHCLVDIKETPFATCKDASRLAAFLSALQTGGGEEAAELLEDGSNDITFTRKPGYVSALKSPGLNEFLQEKGIKSLILTGLSTSGCVLRTAAAASDAEFVVSVISDACADRDEDVHDILLGKVLRNRTYVFTAAEFQKEFASAVSGK